MQKTSVEARCPECDGFGVILIEHDTIPSSDKEIVCPVCKGASTAPGDKDAQAADTDNRK